MQNLQSRQPNGFWLVTVAAIIWGTIGIATQAIYNIDSTTSLFINLSRMIIATPILFVACWRIVGQKMFHIRWRDLLIMLLNGVLLAISQAAYFAAIRYTGVTITTLLVMCIAPLVVTCLSVLLKFEVLTRRLVIALISALIGCVLLVGFEPSEGGNLLIGTLLSLSAACTNAVTMICGRFLARSYHPLQVNTIAFAAGALILIPINLFSGVIVVQTAQGWLLVLYLGIVPTALAYWLFQKGLRSISATTASIVSMLDPVVSALLAWVLFGETLAFAGIVGAGMLLAGIFLLSVEKAE